MTPDKLLEELAELYKKKNEEYKDNWKETSDVLRLLFPKGIKLDSFDDFSRFQFLVMIVGKLTRYVNNWDKGGHEDSLKDMIVYISMLQSFFIIDKDELFHQIKESSDVIDSFMYAFRNCEVKIPKFDPSVFLEKGEKIMPRRAFHKAFKSNTQFPHNQNKKPNCFGNKYDISRCHRCPHDTECIEEHKKENK